MPVIVAVAVCEALLTGLGQLTPAGGKDFPSKPLVSLMGRTSKVTKPGYHRVESAKAWDALWLRHQTGKPEPGDGVPNDFLHGAVDFNRCMVVAVFQGKGINCSGFEVHTVSEAKDRLVVRVEGQYYQTGEGAAATAAWGAFILPRSAKPIVIELDTRLLIADTPKWTRVAELQPGDCAIEK